MYWHRTNISEGIDFLTYGKLRFNTITLRHRILNIVWWCVSLAFALGWAYYISKLL